MKKILFAGTALVAFSVASAAHASSPIKLELGGSAQWLFGVATQSKEFKNGGPSGVEKDYSSTDVKGDNFVAINGSTVLDNGMKVGFHALFRAGGNSNTDHNVDPIDRSYVYVEGRLGKLMVGTVDQAPKMLHVSAPDAAGLSEDAGNGIVSGRWVGAPGTIYYLDTTKINTADAAEKITYFTPRYYGFTLGASFSPGTSSSGWQDTGNRDQGTANETYSLGLGYDNTFAGGVNLKASLGWQFSNQFNAQLAPGLNNWAGTTRGNTGLPTGEVNEYSGGLAVSFDGFTLGGGLRFRDIDRSSWDSIEQWVWTIGAQYAFDKKVVPLTLSLNYFDSQSDLKDNGEPKERDRVHNVNFSGSYELGTGVNWISTIGYIKFDQEGDKTYDNSGIAVITGLNLAF